MRPRFRLPMFVVAAALLALIAVLGTLQYRWLGRISDAERERMTANLGTHATAFAQEFDRELTRAYLTFQLEAVHESGNNAARMAQRHERWIATVTLSTPDQGDLHRVARRRWQRAAASAVRPRDAAFSNLREWPESLRRVEEALAKQAALPSSGEMVVIRTIPSPVWDEIPALVIPTPLMLMNERDHDPGGAAAELQDASRVRVHDSCARP